MENIPDEIIDELNRIKEISAKRKNGISTISINHAQDIAKKHSLSTIEVEIAALKQNIMPARYERNYDTISFSEQIHLLRSSVAVVGCGGLGGNIIEMLARLGIGNLVVIDGDIFNESNLNRQLLCTENNIGKGKAESATARIKHINSSISTKTYSQFINLKNISTIIQGVDLAVDALDNISSRFILERYCKSLKIPLIHGAINNFNGQVSTILPGDNGLETIYGPPEKYDKQNKKSVVSVPSFTPALIASLQVAEVVKVLLNRGKPLRNKLLLINLEELDINILEIG
ncbi:MAG: HesA/MoeB/ThiF family protein [Atribacterota bacterium]